MIIRQKLLFEELLFRMRRRGTICEIGNTINDIEWDILLLRKKTLFVFVLFLPLLFIFVYLSNFAVTIH